MVVTAGVLWCAVAGVYVAKATVGDSNPGDILVGLAALVAAVSGWRAQRSSRKAEGNSAEAVRSLGPSNGTNVLELLHRNNEVLDEIKAFEEYQHLRNHDVLNALARVSQTMPLLLSLAERLLLKLNEENP